MVEKLHLNMHNLLLRSAAGSGGMGTSAPVNFWIQVRRTRREDKAPQIRKIVIAITCHNYDELYFILIPEVP